MYRLPLVFIKGLKDYKRGHKPAPKIALLLGIIIFKIFLLWIISYLLNASDHLLANRTSLYNNIAQRAQ
jgi:hypothetical protein